MDGDTLLLTNGQRVRLVGIDTPEVHPSEKMERDSEGSSRRKDAIRKLGERASRFTAELVTGREITLKFDPSTKANANVDRYGRILAYVYFTPRPCDELELWVADDVCELESYRKGFLNALVVEAGYASTLTRYPFKFMEQFRELEAEARNENRGLWKPDPKSASLETVGPQNVSWAIP